MEDQIRDGFSYEMTISFNITTAGHLTEVDKDRTRLFADKPEFIISETTGKLIKDWCEKGIDTAAIEREQKAAKEEQFKKDLAAASKLLKESATLEALRDAYLSLTDEVKAATIAIKDEMKTKLTPAPATTPSTTA